MRSQASTPSPDVARAQILGCPVDALDLQSTVDRCAELIEAGGGAWQASLNAMKVELCARNGGFAGVLNSSDIVSADGQPIVWASRLLRKPLPGRVNGTDLMYKLFALAERKGLSVYILGASDDVLQRAINRLGKDYPALRIAGTHHGHFSADEEDAVVDRVREVAPDILFVAMPSPRKEELLHRRIGELRVGLAMGVGGSIEVVAGNRTRAPALMQRVGLEWLFRLSQEPGRLWRRYLVGNLMFLWLLAWECARMRFHLPWRPGVRH